MYYQLSKCAFVISLWIVFPIVITAKQNKQKSDSVYIPIVGNWGKINGFPQNWWITAASAWKYNWWKKFGEENISGILNISIYLGILLHGYLVINYLLVFSQYVEISMYSPSFFYAKTLMRKIWPFSQVLKWVKKYVNQVLE